MEIHTTKYYNELSIYLSKIKSHMTPFDVLHLETIHSKEIYILFELETINSNF